jgi:hypothetical protein
MHRCDYGENSLYAIRIYNYPLYAIKILAIPSLHQILYFHLFPAIPLHFHVTCVEC